jgi:hypothetical protein
MKPPVDPVPRSSKTGSLHEKSTVLIAVGPRPSDQVGLGGLTAAGEIDVGGEIDTAGDGGPA